MDTSSDSDSVDQYDLLGLKQMEEEEAQKPAIAADDAKTVGLINEDKLIDDN